MPRARSTSHAAPRWIRLFLRLPELSLGYYILLYRKMHMYFYTEYILLKSLQIIKCKVSWGVIIHTSVFHIPIFSLILIDSDTVLYVF